MANKKSILEYFPYETPYSAQRELLLAIANYWESFDVFVVVAPTAFGKSPTLKAIADWAGNSSIITPTNVLVEQMFEAFPAKDEWDRWHKLQKRALYMCPRFSEGRTSCEVAHAKYGKKLGCNRKCAYLSDLQKARSRGPGVYNYYTYLAHKLYRPNLLIDEGHNALKMLQDLSAAKLWKHDWHYPWDMWSYGDILQWLEHKEKEMGELPEALKGLKSEVVSIAPRYIVKREKEMWLRTTPPEERELLKMLPIDVRDAPPHLWPSQVRKIVMLSATISRKDIEQMGLSRRRVLYLEANSPIPVRNRPIIPKYVCSVNRNNIRESTMQMAQYVEDNFLERYKEVKGFLHATYAQARILRERWGSNPRFIFHDKSDTAQKLEEFKQAPTDSGRIMVASGLYEGVDLVEDLGRWQAVMKIPYPSLGDPAIKYLAEKDSEWYCWQTLKQVMQAAGRICRSPTDTGTTYILDKSFERLYKQAMEYELLPKWFGEAITEEEI